MEIKGKMLKEMGPMVKKKTIPPLLHPHFPSAHKPGTYNRIRFFRLHGDSQKKQVPIRPYRALEKKHHLPPPHEPS